MAIGRLRHRLQLQAATETRNSYGEAILTYATYKTAWGMLTPLKGRELEVAHQVNAEVDYKAEIRHNSDIKPADRIVAKERTFEIVSILNQDERDIRQTLMLKEVV